MFFSALLYSGIYIYWIIPAVCAIACWLCVSGIVYFSVRSAYQKKITGGKITASLTMHITRLIIENRASAIESIVSGDSIEKIMPQIETHIQEFLTKKVPEELPMIAMFLGDKTTNQIKEVFIKELRVLFPKVLAQYIYTATNENRLKDFIEDQISKSSGTLINTVFVQDIRSSLFKMKAYSILFGLLFGSICSLIIFLFA